MQLELYAKVYAAVSPAFRLYYSCRLSLHLSYNVMIKSYSGRWMGMLQLFHTDWDTVCDG